MTAESGARVRRWGPRSLPGRWDVVVVGSGIGGLGAAVLLARAGRRVVVLEQHGVPGGFTQSFTRGGWSWDVGIHVMGEMGPLSVAGRLVDSLAGGRLGWTRVEAPYDVLEAPGVPAIPIWGNSPKLEASFGQAFPREREAIARYFALVRRAAGTMRDRFLLRLPTRAGLDPEGIALCLSLTSDVVRSTGASPALMASLLVQWPFYGVPPERSAFGVHAMLTHHYRRGGFYPQGGAGQIGATLCESLVEAGGWTRVGASVESLVVEGGSVRGVRLADGEVIRADRVVSGAGALNTLALLPPDERARPWAQSIAGLSNSTAHVCLNVGFRGDLRAVGASESNHWLPTRNEPMQAWDLECDLAHFPGIYVSFPSLKDGVARGPDGRHAAEVVVLAGWEGFARWSGTRWKHRGEEYERFKRRLSDFLLERLVARWPGLAPLVVRAELSTPLSTAHFARGVNGAIYGLEVTPERYKNPHLRPRTPVRGLYLAGTDVAMPGVAGALAGGITAAIAAEPERVVAELARVLRRGGPGRARTRA